MPTWADLVGQGEAVASLRAAAESPQAMTHAWLIVGPPGSGRSVAAQAFAAALQTGPEDSPQAIAAQVAAGTHPDVTLYRTEHLQISIATARELVELAHRSPARGRWRVIVVEDADRIAERTANVLLKALEEPPPRTVWVLCAPSPGDLLPTIRSRTRLVELRTPADSEVAQFLTEREGVDPELALRIARLAQSHIGLARAYAREPSFLAARLAQVEEAARVTGVAQAVIGAEKLFAQLSEQANQRGARDLDAERAELLRVFGVGEGERLAPSLRAQLKALEEDHKRRTRRALADEIDSFLVALLGFYRDSFAANVGATVPSITGLEPAPLSLPAAAEALRIITELRARLQEFSSVAPLLALEALLIELSAARSL